MKNSLDLLAPLLVEVDAGGPGALPAGQVLLAELGGVVAHRPEMVVDDVEHHAQPEAVRLVHETPEVIRRAVALRRGEQVHAVVAPAPAPGEVGQGHQLDRRHPQVPERLQPLRDPLEGPLGAEGADVQLVDDQLFRREALPGPVGPAEFPRVHHLRRPVDPLGLVAARRVGERPPAVDLVAIPIPGPCPGHESEEVPVLPLLEGRACAAPGPPASRPRPPCGPSAPRPGNGPRHPPARPRAKGSTPGTSIDL